MTGRIAQLSVGAVVVDDDRLLLVRRGHGPGAGQWAVPGGRLEPDELLQEAVVRELAEETSLEGVCGALIGWVELVTDDRHDVILDFGVDLLEFAEPVASTDAIDARWFPLSDVAELHLAPGLAEFLHDHNIITTIT